MAQSPNNDEFPAVSWSGSPEQGEDSGTLPQIKGYEIVKKLGEGGMGIVYLADQKEPIKRKVALKIIKPGMDSAKVIARFEAERQALAVLDHPNIARVFDAGTTELGRPYFAMEYVEGQAITEYCDEHRLSIEDRLKLFVQVCEAIQFAHQKGIIHRDIKPSNILVSKIGEQVLPKIIDFGVAKAVSQPLTERTLFTEQGQLIGTPEYMSPEQAGMTQEYVDTRSDVYSLGVLLYELLIGRLPFDHETFREAAFVEVLRIIQEQEPPRLSAHLASLGEEAKAVAEQRCTEVVTLVKRLHKELEWIPLMAMRKDPNRRYATVGDLSRDIHNYLNNNPLIAGPESVVYRGMKFLRRHRALVVTLLICVVSVTIAGASMRLYRQARVDFAEVDEARVFAEEQWKIAESEVEDAIALIAKMELEETGGNTDTHDQNQQALTEDDPVGDAPHDLSRFILSLLGEDPYELIRTTWDAILQVLRTEEVNPELKSRAINHIFDTVFDFPLMAMLAVEKHSSKLTPAQAKEFTECFAKDFKDSLRKEIMLHADRTMTIMSVVRKTEALVYIPVKLTNDNGPVSMVYKLRKSRDHWKIYDVEVAGVSMLLTHMQLLNVESLPKSGRSIGGVEEDVVSNRGRVKLEIPAENLNMPDNRGSNGYVNSVESSPDGKGIVPDSRDETLKVWDSASPEEVEALENSQLATRDDLRMKADQGDNADGEIPNDATALARVTVAKDPDDLDEVLWKKWDVIIEDPNDPNEVLWKKWCAVVRVFQAKEINMETKAKIIDKVISPIFDFPVMTRLVLGRKHWSQFTEPQREQFTKLFTKRFKTSYREKMSLYSYETASLTLLKPAVRENERTIYIPMEIISDDKKIAILYRYRFRKSDTGWKIYDVEIQGVSIIQTYMLQFNDFLVRSTVDELISQMEKP